MIKKVIQISDVHIRPYQRLDEYSEQLTKVTSLIKDIIAPYEKDEVRIVLCGDIVHSKTSISNELIAFVSTWIRELEGMAEVIVYAGNHDLIVGNNSRMDSITAIFTAANYQNSVYMDSYLGYDSGIVVEDNVTWALYSIFADYRRPDIESAKEEYPENIVLGLYHGDVVGAVMANGMMVDSGADSDAFSGCDFVLAGHIHKRQVLKRGDTEIVYPSSLIQQNFGETITQHGFAVWDIENRKYEFVDVPTDYSLYDFEIKSIEDLDNNKEILRNY